MSRLIPKVLAVLSVAAALCRPTMCVAQVCTPLTPIVPPDNPGVFIFGNPMAISGNFAVLGSSRDATNGPNTGAAYIYEFTGTTWEFRQKLMSPHPAAEDYFGSAVDIDGDVIVVGASSDDTAGLNAGAVFVFDRTDKGWTLRQQIVPLVKFARSFGYVVAIEGGRIIVWCSQNLSSLPALSELAVYQVQGDEWQLSQEIMSPEPFVGDQFGYVFRFDGSTLAVRSLFHDQNGQVRDAVYIFEHSGGQFDSGTRLLPDDPSMNLYWSIGLQQDELVVGGRPYTCADRVLVFRRNGTTWSQAQSISSPDGANSGTGFGTELAIEQDLMLIGAPNAPNGRGSIFVYRRVDGTWRFEHKLTSPIDQLDVWLPQSMAIDDGRVLAGTSIYGVFGFDDLPMVDCNHNARSDACDLSEGHSPDVNNNGIPDECDTNCSTTRVFDLELVPDYAQDRILGRNVTIFGDFAASGFVSFNADEPGFVQLYQFDGQEWVTGVRLRPSDSFPQDHFGHDVSIAHDWMAVSAPVRDGAVGQMIGANAVYFFERNGSEWIQRDRDEPPEVSGSIWFGFQVACNGSLAAVSSPVQSVDGVMCGAVHVYRREGVHWIREAVIEPNNSFESQGFGWTLAMSSDRVAVGSYGHFGKGRSVAVYVRTSQGWNLEQEFFPIQSPDNGGYGTSLALDGEALLIGAPTETHVGHSPGAVHIYVRSEAGWTLRQTLLGPQGNPWMKFGSAVALQGHTALIGAPLDGWSNGDRGKAYLYKRLGVSWVQQLEFDMSSVGPEFTTSPFGGAVALDRDTAIIGAPDLPTYCSELTRGSVSIYTHISREDCNNNGIPDGCDIANHLVSDVNTNGIPDECEVLACAADIAPPEVGDGEINIDDLVAVIVTWGHTDSNIPADITHDGVVNIDDLVAVITTWGPCP